MNLLTQYRKVSRSPHKEGHMIDGKKVRYARFDGIRYPRISEEDHEKIVEEAYYEVLAEIEQEKNTVFKRVKGLLGKLFS